MPQDIIYFDIASVVVIAITLLSFLMRRLTNRPATRVYFAAMILVLVTAVVNLGGEIYDAFLGPLLLSTGLVDAQNYEAGRSFLTLLYYAIRVLTAPAYLILIATVSDTTYRMNNSNLKRVLLWTPMLLTIAFVLLNPLHHLVYYYEGGVSHRGPCIAVLYATAIYYALIGIGWLIRWREAFDANEFSTLMMIFPFMFTAVYIQYYYSFIRVDMFTTAVSMMLISAFVVPPEKHVDTHMKAANLFAYREKCRRAFLTGRPLSLVYVGMVNIGQLRELAGQDMLQDIIADVSQRLTGTLANDDVLYYLRDGLFCIIPRRADAQRALEVAREMHEQAKARTESGRLPDGTPQTVPEIRMRSCVVRIPEDAKDPETLQAFVRRFPHLVPDSRVTSFEELSQQPGFGLEMALAGIVDAAIRNRSFEVYYQPIYCMADGRFHSAEALVRLRDPEFGWVPPSLFIPEAEQNGTIVTIGDILLEKVCAFLGTLDYGRTQLEYVEMNLSIEQCIQPDLVPKLLQAMERNGVEPRRVNLEITETSSSYSQQIVESNVRLLAEAGCTLSLDDFGTGYSNIERALSLPFSLIKLDKSLIDGLGDPASREVVARTIAMMKAIGKDVLAEGVETREQVELLGEMGVDYIQGYRFSKALPENEFIRFLEEQR